MPNETNGSFILVVMIRMIQSTSAAQAKAYYADALLKSDYYLSDQELGGEFRGRLAERLQVRGAATKEQFFALCENRSPVNGRPITPRTKAERTTGYDINFHCPKSVSIVHALSNDSHILEAFQQSVNETMADIEADSRARVRKGGAYADRKTGELVWVDFTHQTARPVDGSEPDPHLHSHCYVFNATWDSEERRYKAAQFRDIKRDMPYYEALFHKKLSDRLMAQGYGIRRSGKSFEIEGVPQRVIDLFSKRTDEIGRIAKEQGITDTAALDGLGARTRARKQKGMSMEELRSHWRQQINDLPSDTKGKEEDEMPVRNGQAKASVSVDPHSCVDYALSHAFERASVMPYRRLLETAYRHGIGSHKTTSEAIAKQLEGDERLIQITDRGRIVCTTKEVLREEKRMVELARKGQNKCRPLYEQAPAVTLTGQQGEAVKHVLTTPDRVSIVRGAAGTGKTTLMKETVDWIEKTGHSVTVVAPTSSASRGVLRDEGFKTAETVALFLKSPALQESIKDGVLWVDEAGLLGTRDMAALLEIATKQDARVILGGDTRQHASVVRGDALRILNTVGCIQTAEVSKIYRQKDPALREAVEELSKGNVGEGFAKLDGIGVIKTVDPLKPNETLVDDFMKAIKQGKDCLVISPTNSHREQVTMAIRDRLRQAKKLGKKEIVAERLGNLNLTEAQKWDWRNFKPGQVVQFNQNVTGIKRGSQWTVKSASKEQVMIAGKEGRTTFLPMARSASYEVFEKETIALAKGDKVRITKNGFDQKERRLNNGQVLEVAAVNKRGDIQLRSKTDKKAAYAITKDFGHIDHAHCITSYAAQGKTVDEIFIAQPAATFGATDAKQFYVSVSRGRDKAHIYTDDKAELLAHASELGDRTSALELVDSARKHKEHVEHLQRDTYANAEKEPAPAKDVPEPSPILHVDWDYEPGL